MKIGSGGTACVFILLTYMQCYEISIGLHVHICICMCVCVYQKLVN